MIFRFSERGVEESDLPDDGDLSGRDTILREIEADYASYLYRRDRTEPNEEEGQKELRWKKDAEELIDRYLKHEYNETYYGVVE